MGPRPLGHGQLTGRSPFHHPSVWLGRPLKLGGLHTR